MIGERIEKLFPGNNIGQDYKKKLDEYKIDCLYSFLADLRNYILHKGILPIASVYESHVVEKEWNPTTIKEDMKGPKQVSKRYVGISKKELNDYFKWKTKSKEYIDNSPTTVDLIQIFQTYQSFINEFYDWFNEFVKKTFSEEIENSEMTLEKFRRQFGF